MKKSKKKKSHEKTREKKKKKLLTPQRIKGGAVCVLTLVVLAAVGLYFYGPLGKATYPIFKHLPYPVAIVGSDNDVITSRRLIFNTEAVKQFYSSQDYSEIGMRVDFETDEGKKRLKIKEKDVLDKLIENHLVEDLARERNIKLTKKQVEAEIKKKIKEGGDEKSLKLSLKSLYGWSLDDFQNEVVIYQMYLKRLIANYLTQVRAMEAFEEITKAKNEIKKDGSNFAQIAQEYSKGESAKNGGSLGWFKKDQLLQEVAEVAFVMETGEISDVIASPLGFHIIKVEEFKTTQAEEGSKKKEIEKQVRLSQIFIQGDSFLKWLENKKKESKVIILMKDYKWDKEQGEVIFRDPKMQNMEKSIRTRSTGDPSL